jgi:hypothetical protein
MTTGAVDGGWLERGGGTGGLGGRFIHSQEVAMQFVRHQRIWLKDHPDLNEKWVQERIAEDPTILGLGDVVLRDKERPQPHAGRLDLLLQDAESDRRYEVEVQLGGATRVISSARLSTGTSRESAILSTITAV